MINILSQISEKQTLYIAITGFFIMGVVLNILLMKNINKTEYKLQKVDFLISSVISGALASFLVIKYSISYEFGIFLLLSIILVSITVLDYRHKIILDRLNLMILILALMTMILNQSYKSSIIGFMVFGFGFLFLSLATGGGIGGGDIKMIAPIGLMFGVAGTYYIFTWTFLYAGAIAFPKMISKIVFKRKNLNESIALGPYISLGTLTFILYWI